MAKAVRAIVAQCLGASNICRNFNQCWMWCEHWLPSGEKFYTLGIAAICWVIWKTCNSVCFEGKIVTSPISIICYACSLMEYWAGLFLDDDKDQLVTGANTMLKIVLQLMGEEAKAQRNHLLKYAKSKDQDDKSDDQNS